MRSIQTEFTCLYSLILSLYIARGTRNLFTLRFWCGTSFLSLDVCSFTRVHFVTSSCSDHGVGWVPQVFEPLMLGVLLRCMWVVCLWVLLVLSCLALLTSLPLECDWPWPIGPHSYLWGWSSLMEESLESHVLYLFPHVACLNQEHVPSGQRTINVLPFLVGCTISKLWDPIKGIWS